MNRSTVEKRAEKVVSWSSWNKELLPLMDVDGLVLVVQNAHKCPQINEMVMGKCLRAGVLSRSLQGNYSLEVISQRDFWVGPESKGRLFFTCEDNCGAYIDALDINGVQMILPQNNFQVSTFPSPIEWAVIRVKAKKQIDLYIMDQLIKGGILTREQQGNYSVFYQRTRVQPIPFNLVDGEDTYYFTGEQHAENYIKAFPVPSKMSVVKN